MKKFEITKEHFEIRTTATEGWSSDKILNAYDDRYDCWPKIIASFDFLDEAEAFFETQKESCHTYRVRGNICWLLEAEVIALCENEYDEEGAWVGEDIIYDRYAEPLEAKSYEGENEI